MNAPFRSIYDKFLEFRSVVIQAIAKAWQDDKFRKKLLDEKAQEKDPHYVIKLLEKEFNYHFPLKRVIIGTFPDNAVWDPERTNDWVVKKREQLTMILPTKPKNKKDEAIALAAYFRNNISLV